MTIPGKNPGECLWTETVITRDEALKASSTPTKQDNRIPGTVIPILTAQVIANYLISGCLRVPFFPRSPPKTGYKSTRINISRNHSKSLNLPDLQETVSNLRKCIFHDFYILANKVENGCTWKIPDIGYNQHRQSS